MSCPAWLTVSSGRIARPESEPSENALPRPDAILFSLLDFQEGFTDEIDNVVACGAPAITTQPANRTNNAGTTATFSVVASSSWNRRAVLARLPPGPQGAAQMFLRHEPTFDFVVANFPFSTKAWSNGFDPANDLYSRFAFGIPPRKNGNYAFLLHILACLKSTGKGAVILPHGVLFRGNVEADIRREIVRRGYIKGIIGLPTNLFYGTGIPACIIVLDKENAAARKGIFMIDASQDFIKDGNKNRLRAQDIHRIVDTAHDYKNGKRRFKSDLIPAAILIARYFVPEREGIEAIERELAEIEQQLDEQKEEQGGDGGLLEQVIEGEGDKRKITAKVVKARLKEIGKDPNFADERLALDNYAAFEKQSDAKTRPKQAVENFDRTMGPSTPHSPRTRPRRSSWTTNGSPPAAAVQGELDRVSQTLTGRIRQLAERYDLTHSESRQASAQ
jgi:hypothetical protein